MKRSVIIAVSLLAISLTDIYGQNRKDDMEQFITKMYNETLYEDHDFLRKHCSSELLKKLQDAYPYDSDDVAYATWLFRSGQQDDRPGSDGKSVMLEVKADGDWYVYTALDMGWEFTNRIKVCYGEGGIVIVDIVTDR